MAEAVMLVRDGKPRAEGLSAGEVAFDEVPGRKVRSTFPVLARRDRPESARYFPEKGQGG
jgi:hypothetical protein